MRSKIRKIIFRIRWILMSESSKYDYLWKRLEENE